MMRKDGRVSKIADAVHRIVTNEQRYAKRALRGSLLIAIYHI